MNQEHWVSIINRVTAFQPLDLDDDIRKFAPLSNSAASSHMLCGENGKQSAYLWQHDNPNGAFLGVRIKQFPDDIAQLAISLASLAIEKQLYPIILTTLDDTGLQQYGFRVERIAGETPLEITQCEREFTAFWGLVVIVDLDQITTMTKV